MFDLSNLPKGAIVEQWVGSRGNTVSRPHLFSWPVPKGKSNLLVVLVGPGGDGGAGFGGAAGTARGGGAGGSGGACTTLYIPTFFLPKVLFFQVGNAGAAPTNTVMGYSELLGVATGFTDTYAYSAVGSFGGAGSATAGGTVNSAGTGFGNRASALGIFLSRTPVLAGAGGAQTGATGINVALIGSSSTALTMGGCGGAGVGTANTDFAGGLIGQNVAITRFPAIPAGVAGGGAGKDGGSILLPYAFLTGGTGGGSSGASGTGGKGGDGGFGCGGGGGGGGVTGGAGGRGGAGLILLAAW